MLISTLRFVTRLAVVLALFAIATQSALAQTPSKCPSELLFSMGGYYYYAVIDCGNSQTQTEIYVYPQTVETGCKADKTCNTSVPVYAVISQPSGGVGDPPNQKKEEKTFKPVPVEEQLMTPFGNSQIAMVGSPSFVKASILDEDRYFKVFDIRYGTNTYSFGVEVNKDPASVGKTVKDGTFDGYGTSVVKISIAGSTRPIEAIYEK